MSKTLSTIRPAAVCLCIFALLVPTPIQAVTNRGYRGNTIRGRSSVAILNGPGGTKVNTFLGNVFLPRGDLLIPGRGLPIEIKLTYNSNQNGIAGPFGFGWKFNYDMKCLLSASRNVVVEWGDGRTDLFRYSSSGYVPYNEGVFASLQQVGNTLRLTTLQGIQYLFDTSLGLLQRIQDPNGNALSFTYSAGQLTTITDASGRRVLLSYDASGSVTTITDPNASPARTLRYGYDGNGNQVSFTDPLGDVTTHAYDAGHRLIKVADPLGITQLSYGPPNMTVASISRLTLTNVLLSAASFDYNTSTSTTTVTHTINGSVTSSTAYQYDAHRRLVSITDSLGAVGTATYDSKGNMASVTDPNGHTMWYTYDAMGNLLAATDALNHTTTFTYSLFSKVASVTDANGHTTTYSYDGAGNLLSRQDALGNVTTYSYDATGQLVERQNARGATTTFAYDSFGDPVRVADPLNRSRTFTYDQVGNALSRTDAFQSETRSILEPWFSAPPA